LILPIFDDGSVLLERQFPIRSDAISTN